jgi:hypothetical protein
MRTCRCYPLKNGKRIGRANFYQHQEIHAAFEPFAVSPSHGGTFVSMAQSDTFSDAYYTVEFSSIRTMLTALTFIFGTNACDFA